MRESFFATSRRQDMRTSGNLPGHNGKISSRKIALPLDHLFSKCFNPLAVTLEKWATFRDTDQPAGNLTSDPDHFAPDHVTMSLHVLFGFADAATLQFKGGALIKTAPGKINRNNP